MRQHLSLSLLFLLLVLGAANAQAQDSSESGSKIDVSHARFDATGTGFSVLASPQTLGLLQGGGGFTMHLSDEPFVLYSSDEDGLTREGGVIQSQFVLDLFGAIGFGFMDVGLVLPVSPVIVWGGDPTDGDFPVYDNDLGGVGDLLIIPKVRLVDVSKRGVGFGIQVPVSIPTGHASRYLGNDGPGVAVDLLVELKKGPVRGLFNIAPIHVRPKFEYGDFVRHLGMDWGAGIAVSLSEMVGVRSEVWGTVSYLGGDESRVSAEWSASLSLKASEMVSMELGAGSGLAGFGAPKLRAFAGVRITSPERGDRDGDGLLDSKDECPDEAEDFDSWDDSDGCPDPDNDGDGILDLDDACPENAENIGVGHDDDGCPDVIEAPAEAVGGESGDSGEPSEPASESSEPASESSEPASESSEPASESSEPASESSEPAPEAAPEDSPNADGESE